MKNGMMKAAVKSTAAKAAAGMLAAATMFAALAPAPVYAAERACGSNDPVIASGEFNLGDFDTADFNYYQPVFVENYTGSTLEELYITGSLDGDWGNDLMGNYVLLNGGQVWTEFLVYGNNTSYDIMGVLDDGSVVTNFGFDFSDVSTAGFVLELDANSVSIYY